MLTWGLATKTKIAVVAGVVATCVASGVGLASSQGTPTRQSTAAATSEQADPHMYSGVIPVDSSDAAVTASDARLAHEVGPSAELRTMAAQQAGKMKVAAAVASTSRAAILQRAKEWIDDEVPYCQTRKHDGFRMDCSGYVSMAWGLSTPGLVTWTLPGVSTRISTSRLMPGDILLHTQKHVMLFVGYADKAHTKMVLWHSTSGSGKCPMNRGAEVTVRSVKAVLAAGYHARTRHNINAEQDYSGVELQDDSDDTSAEDSAEEQAAREARLAELQTRLERIMREQRRG